MNRIVSLLLGLTLVLPLLGSECGVEISDLDSIRLRINRQLGSSLHLSIERVEDDRYILRYADTIETDKGFQGISDSMKLIAIKAEDFRRIEEMILDPQFREDAVRASPHPDALDGEGWSITATKGGYRFGSTTWNPRLDGTLHKIAHALMKIAGIDLDWTKIAKFHEPGDR